LALHEASRDAGTVDGEYTAENVVREAEIGQSLAGDDAVRDLASHYFPDNVTPLHLASRHGRVEVVCFLLKLGVDVAAQDKFRSIPLHYVSNDGQVDIVRILIDRGADVKAKNANGQTPLHDASLNGHAEVVCMLIEHGADVTAQNQNESSSLHEAL